MYNNDAAIADVRKVVKLLKPKILAVVGLLSAWPIHGSATCTGEQDPGNGTLGQG